MNHNAEAEQTEKVLILSKRPELLAAPRRHRIKAVKPLTSRYRLCRIAWAIDAVQGTLFTTWYAVHSLEH